METDASLQKKPGNQENQRPILPWLWLLAGLVALALLLATGALYVRANSQASTFAGVVAGPEGAVYLRSRPHPTAGVVTVLEAGDPVDVHSSRDVEGTLWYEIRTERSRGWLPAERVERRE